MAIWWPYTWTQTDYPHFYPKTVPLTKIQPQQQQAEHQLQLILILLITYYILYEHLKKEDN